MVNFLMIHCFLSLHLIVLGYRCHEKCQCVLELGSVFCTNITHIPQLPEEVRNETALLRIINSNLQNLNISQAHWPLLSYIDLTSSNISCFDVDKVKSTFNLDHFKHHCTYSNYPWVIMGKQPPDVSAATLSCKELERINKLVSEVLSSNILSSLSVLLLAGYYIRKFLRHVRT